MKILVIGLDAATFDLIEPWGAAGHLPALTRLINEGTSARLISTPNMHSASAWTSILTGLNPGRHGLFVFSDRDFASGKQIFFKGGDRIGELIGSHLARHRLTSGFLNVPMTYPAQCAQGSFMVSGLDAPSLNDRAFCPGELREELLHRFPDYDFAPRRLGDLMRGGRLDDAARQWLNLVEIQTSAAEYLINSRPTDLFMIVYTASDWAGHNLWKFSQASADKNPILEIYSALDGAIGRLIQHANSDTQIYVVSDHGMGPHTGASYHLADWLESSGYLVRRRRAHSPQSVISASRNAIRSVVPASLRERAKERIGEERLQRLRAVEKDSFYASVDWEHTVAYTEPGRHVININLEGRNANGIVAPSDYDRTCLRIIAELNNWKDVSGTPVVERVVRRDEAYSGPFVERASDLFIHWNTAADLGEPPDEVRARGFWWSGDHRPDGVLIIKGPGIRPNTRGAAQTVYDLAPTITYAAGLPVPDKLDGRVIQSAFTEEFLAERPIQIEEASSISTQGQIQISAAEEQAVEEKLRSLGYM